LKSEYALLGMDTAWQRFDSARGGRKSAFDEKIRALEAAAVGLNLEPEAVHLAAEIASFGPALEADERIALIVLTLVSLAALQEGSTRFPVVGPLSKVPMRRMLDALCADGFGPDASEGISNSIEDLIRSNRASAVIGRDKNEYKPLLFLTPFIFHQRIQRNELQLANRLTSMLKDSAGSRFDSIKLNTALDDVFSRPVIVEGRAIALSDEQRRAVAAAARAGLTVISGGPGTGKTSIVVAIMRLMVRLGIDPSQILLMAPTGKAAYRMGECIRESLTRIEKSDDVDLALRDANLDPATIHRQLGYSIDSGRFRHHRNNPLSAKVVIVDEGSMLDLALMERLTDAIQPGARLILLGDANQLPSVAAGSVFRDLVPHPSDGTGALAGASVRLVENHRMKKNNPGGNAILRAAKSINEGQSDLLNSNPAIFERRSSPDELTFSGAEFLAVTSRVVSPFLDRWYAERVRGEKEIAELLAHEYIERDNGFDDADCDRLRRLFKHAASSRILCVTRVFATGSEAINAHLHSRAAENAGVAAELAPFVVGEPLLVLRNDYERGLFNGDNGIRLWVQRGDARQIPMAVFPRANNFVAFSFEALREFVELAYAMTVHKAQGSEFDSTAIVLPEKPIAILTRQLLYTAVSRSKTSVVVFGAESILKTAIENPVERFSGLSDQIKAANDPDPQLTFWACEQ
jgi:exodeoxyribonuclease V alpha subunit